VSGIQSKKGTFPQIKICGLTQPKEAIGCAGAGADAIGLVFFSKSPRNVTIEQARSVVRALPRTAATVGVFVNADFEFIMKRVDRCGLSTVQLHGRESSGLATRLMAEGVGVIKALFVDGRPGLDNAADYHVDGYLVECAKGPLPGGNAMAWDWGAAADVGRRYPLILAGGLCEDNVSDAIAACRPAAVDVSSGVEASPGRKDARRVSQFIEAVQSSASDDDCPMLQPVFSPERHRRHD